MAFGTLYGSGINFSEIFTPPTTGDRNYGAQPTFALGQLMFGSGNTAFVYVKFGTGGATGAGYLCNISPAFDAVMSSTGNDAFGTPVGAAQAVAVAGDYGWVQIYGPGLLRGAASTAINVPLAPTATDGQVDDGAAVGALVFGGLTYTTAVGGAAGTSAAWFNWPCTITNPNITP